MLDGLTHKHSIERIAMERRQFVKMKHGTLMKRERRYSMPFTMSHDELSSAVGSGNIPSACLTEISHTDTART